jgi:predicted transcriptional regulator
MVAPNYAAKRSELAKKIGLGRKPGKKIKSGKVAK